MHGSAFSPVNPPVSRAVVPDTEPSYGGAVRPHVPEIYVDGDACPVKNEVLKVAARHRLVVHIVSNRLVQLKDSPSNVRLIVVSKRAGSVDDWIVARIRAGDIAVTADIPLANRCLEVGARAIGPAGKPFDMDNIGMALAMRDLTANLRDVGRMVGQAAAFSKRDRSRFLEAMENAVQATFREYRT